MMSTFFSTSTTTSSFLNGSPTKLQDLCRMCASPCVKSVQIFGSEGVANELAAKFSSHLPLKISEADTLPLQLCYECTNLLIQWDAAVLVATAADKKLRALQWRQQQSQTLEKTKETSGTMEQDKHHKASGVTSMESITCSICNKSGMYFREFVEHLKSHNMSNESSKASDDNDAEVIARKKQKTTLTRSSVSEDDESSSELNHSKLSKPTRRKLRSNRKSAAESQSLSRDGNSDGIQGRLRAKKLKNSSKQEKINISNTAEDSGDPVVTSSTNSKAFEQLSRGNLLSPSTASGEKPKPKETIKDSPGNLSFKPKVRIISAESINQSLEERAKANRNVNLEPSQNNIFVPALGPSSASPHSLLKPKITYSSPKSGQLPTRIVMSGGIVKDIKGEIRSGMKFLKLPDGRIIRLLQSPSKMLQKTSPQMSNSSSVQQAVPKSVFSKLLSAKHPLIKDGNQEKQGPGQDSNDSTETNQDCPVSPLLKDNNGVKDEESASLPPQRESITLSNSRIVSFNIQPGPKNSVNRYYCSFCGKRNLLQDNLHTHAQTHCPKETGPNQASSPSK